MALTVAINHPEFPDGTEFGVAGAFLVPNNGSVELTEEQELTFAAKQGRLVSDALADNEMFQLSGSPAVSELPTGIPVDDRTDEERGIAVEEETSPQQEGEQSPQEGEQPRPYNPDAVPTEGGGL